MLGNVVIGHVLDCNKKHFEKTLKDFDRELYLKWNPAKRKGNGMWELRRRPEQLTAVPKSELNGSVYFSLEPVESNLIHHVMDLECINYNVLTRLREMDTWRLHESFGADLEYREEKEQERLRSQSRAELRYQIRHNRKAFQYALEVAQAGRNAFKLFMD